MTYNPVTDFLALVRNGSGGASIAEVPGLDYIMAALARSGLFRLSVGQTAPIVNQASTVWLKTSLPSWVAEGTVFLWDGSTETYVPATPDLWAALLSPSTSNVFQSVAVSAGAVNAGTTLFAVQRANPTATALALPSVFVRPGKALRLVDWSIDVTDR